MYIPFTCLMPYSVRTKLKLINEIKSEISKTYDNTVSKSNLFKFLVNYKKIHRNELFEYPLFIYDVELEKEKINKIDKIK